MTQPSVPTVLERLGAEFEGLSPQLKKAAAYVLDHPDEIGLSSTRQLADAAGVKPNTFVRMARAVGFDGFEDFREPFRRDLQGRTESFQDRAEWLQTLSAEGQLGSLYADLAGSTIANMEKTFANVDAMELEEIADLIVGSRRTYVIGVGANFALAHNFAYLLGMALDSVIAVPAEGNVPIDSLVRAGSNDVVIALTFAPYRYEVVEAVDAARRQQTSLVAITDSHGSPIATGAEHVLITPTEGPQFFPSTLAAAALLETLASLIIADAGKEVVSAIDRFHKRRYDLGVYLRNGQ